MKYIKIFSSGHNRHIHHSEWKYRNTVRAIVFDAQERIGLLHVANEARYKLPGGGIYAEENLVQALQRECREELGVVVKVVEPLESVMELRGNDLMCQISHCFIAEVVSSKCEQCFTKKEASLGYSISWVSATEAREVFCDIPKDVTLKHDTAIQRDRYVLEKALQIYKG